MGNNPSRYGGYDSYDGYSRSNAPVYSNDPVYRSRSLSYGHSQRPGGYYGTGTSHRRAYTTDMGYSRGYVPQVVQQPYAQGYAQYSQPQQQYITQVHNPPQPFQQFVPVQAPQMVFPQPQVHMQPVIPSMPTQIQPGVIYAPQVATMSIPQPQMQTQYQFQPVIPSGPIQNTNAPVIPQMSSAPQQQQNYQSAPMSMPEPMTFPEPQRNPTPSRLQPGQYGTYDPRSRTPPRHNPLPSPPKDLFELSPYVSLLHDLRRPVDGASLKRTYSVPPSGGANFNRPSSRTGGAHFDRPSSRTGGTYADRPSSRTDTRHGSRREKRHKRSLFGSIGHVFNPRRHDDSDTDSGTDSDEPERRRAAPAPLFGATYTSAPTRTQLPDGSTAYVYSAPQAQGAPVIPGNTPGTRTPREILKIDRGGGLAGLLHASPHPVHWAGREWPSALHALEGLRFLDTRPDIAEEIRRTTSAEEVAPIVASAREHARPDWEQAVLHVVDEVLYEKFVEHPHLRGLLMGTGAAELVYSTSHDGFWGDGMLGRGANELGKALVRVRERLRADGY